ncbi:hypothetical protein [Brachybacterium sp. FME24]|uniref:hypothetical protein n=1 Tax=Brachybacterium sp. FME24 TaxID=2742605 RepID=UPI001867A47E|nr:hypothetical protein [Brachybacterium sp. FME24]
MRTAIVRVCPAAPVVDGRYSVEQLIAGSDSSNFYTPDRPAIADTYGGPSETVLGEELWTLIEFLPGFSILEKIPEVPIRLSLTVIVVSMATATVAPLLFHRSTPTTPSRRPRVSPPRTSDVGAARGFARSPRDGHPLLGRGPAAREGRCLASGVIVHVQLPR